MARMCSAAWRLVMSMACSSYRRLCRSLLELGSGQIYVNWRIPTMLCMLTSVGTVSLSVQMPNPARTRPLHQIRLVRLIRIDIHICIGRHPLQALLDGIRTHIPHTPLMRQTRHLFPTRIYSEGAIQPCTVDPMLIFGQIDCPSSLHCTV